MISTQREMLIDRNDTLWMRERAGFCVAPSLLAGTCIAKTNLVLTTGIPSKVETSSVLQAVLPEAFQILAIISSHLQDA
jgi:hypothetical protein